MTHVEMPQVEAPERPLSQPALPDTCAIIAAGGVGKRFGNPNGCLLYTSDAADEAGMV